MSTSYRLTETEERVDRAVGHLPLDHPAAHAVSSLYRAANAARSYLTNTVLRPHELTWTSFVVLWVVWVWDDMETRDVAEEAGISKATLTGVAKTLEARGLITRRTRTSDRRLVVLELTDAGRRLMEELYPRFNMAETELVAGLSARGVQDMTRGLRKVVEVAEHPDKG